MINGYTHVSSVLNDILSKLQNSTFVYQLTGSRFFGTSKDGSDWDFFTQNGYGPAAELIRMGFHEKYNDYTGDLETTEVYEHSCGIHVQLVRNFKVKQEAQNILFAMDVGNVLTDKTAAAALWTLAIRLAEEKEKKPITLTYMYPENALQVIRQMEGTIAWIPAIKLYRHLTGVGLVEAKKAIDSLPTKPRLSGYDTGQY